MKKMLFALVVMISVVAVSGCVGDSQEAADVSSFSDCAKISDQTSRDSCYSNMAENIDQCDMITKASIKETCYFRFVDDIKDSSFCNKLTLEDLHANCLRIFEWKDAVPNKCESLPEDEWYSCYENVYAYKDPNNLPEFCSGINDDYNRGICYGRSAIKLNDSSYCEMIGDADFGFGLGTVKDACYFDLRICEKILEESKKELCIELGNE